MPPNLSKVFFFVFFFVCFTNFPFHTFCNRYLCTMRNPAFPELSFAGWGKKLGIKSNNNVMLRYKHKSQNTV